MTNILVVKKLNSFSLLIVILFKFLKTNPKVYVYQKSTLFFKDFFFKYLSLEECDFANCIDVDLNAIYGKDGITIDQVVDEFIDQKTIEVFSQFFINIKTSEDKIRLLVRDYVFNRSKVLTKISIWINGSFQSHSGKPQKIYYFGDICRISESFLLKECAEVKIIPILPSNLYLFYGLALKIFKLVTRRLFNYFRISKIIKTNELDNSNLVSVISNNVNISQYKVLFFPHQSIFFGDLFIKDHFYNMSQDSVFHPSKILHLEFNDIFLTKEKAKYYSDNDIKTVLFPKASLKKYFKNLIYLIKTIGVTQVLSLLKKNLILTFVLFSATLNFISTRQQINNYSKANLVLVGYENNFPLITSLGFESLKIKTVAIQERFILAFMANMNFILDTYLCHSEFVSDMVQLSKNKFAQNCIPCGQIRTDELVDLKVMSNNNIFTIVAFDFHSVQDIHENRATPLFNWKANKSFYEDLLKLSNNIPNIRIIIRGKNLDWTKITFFDDTLEKINNNPNVIVDSDYSNFAQYKISAHANLIIAKHTSIADELIAVGKQVIFHDFSPNTKPHAKPIFNYNNLNIYAHSYNELEIMVKEAVNHNKLLSESNLLELQLAINNGPADGLVRKRIMNNINLLYQENLNTFNK
jgi:hypothetical protein